MELHIAKYQRLIIYRQSLIMLIAAPIPAAVVSIQGTLLTPDVIAAILIMGNVFAMASTKFNTLPSKFLFVVGGLFSIIACLGILWMYAVGIGIEYIIVFFPIMSGMGYLLSGIASNQIKNRIKSSYTELFDIAEFEAKKQSFVSGAAIIGQLIGVLFYMTIDVEPIFVLLVLETINMVLYMIAEVQRWKLIVIMGVDR